MSEFKFNCSNCGQHLAGDSSYAGLQIICPSCGKTVVVPAAPPPPGLAIASNAPRKAPPPLPPPPAQQKTCGLAIASLICSVGSFLIIPLGFIPGIICGHMAKKKIALTPGLQGRGMAKAGLIVGYVALSLNVLVVIAVAVFFFLFAARVKGTVNPTFKSQQRVSRTQPAASADKETTDTEPDGSGWTMKLEGVEIPSDAVGGRIHQQPFKMEKVTLEGGWLKFREGSDFFADREIDVVIFENITRLSGRTLTVPKKEFGPNPHIWMKWKESEGNQTRQRCFMDRYALRLEFGQPSDGKLPGRIYLCLPDKEKSFIAGTFEVPVEGAVSGQRAAPPRPSRR